jgi:hypothetical protein
MAAAQPVIASQLVLESKIFTGVIAAKMLGQTLAEMLGAVL